MNKKTKTESIRWVPRRMAALWNELPPDADEILRPIILEELGFDPEKDFAKLERTMGLSLASQSTSDFARARKINPSIPSLKERSVKKGDKKISRIFPTPSQVFLITKGRENFRTDLPKGMRATWNNSVWNLTVPFSGDPPTAKDRIKSIQENRGDPGGPSLQGLILAMSTALEKANPDIIEVDEAALSDGEEEEETESLEQVRRDFDLVDVMHIHIRREDGVPSLVRSQEENFLWEINRLSGITPKWWHHREGPDHGPYTLRSFDKTEYGRTNYEMDWTILSTNEVGPWLGLPPTFWDPVLENLCSRGLSEENHFLTEGGDIVGVSTQAFMIGLFELQPESVTPHMQLGKINKVRKTIWSFLRKIPNTFRGYKVHQLIDPPVSLHPLDDMVSVLDILPPAEAAKDPSPFPDIYSLISDLGTVEKTKVAAHALKALVPEGTVPESVVRKAGETVSALVSEVNNHLDFRLSKAQKEVENVVRKAASGDVSPLRNLRISGDETFINNLGQRTSYDHKIVVKCVQAISSGEEDALDLALDILGRVLQEYDQASSAPLTIVG